VVDSIDEVIAPKPPQELTAEQEHRQELTDGLVNQRHGLREQIEALEQSETKLTYLRTKVAAIEATLGQLGWVADDTPDEPAPVSAEELPPGSA
jgi:septal ring factor EnvC (AmiA/AmiB activator)